MNPPTNPLQWSIGLVGYGEVGRILAEDFRRQGMPVAACDIKVGAGETATMQRHAEQFGIALSASHADVAAGSDLIISAVTAGQTVAAAAASAAGMKPGAFFLDFNSASPAAKIEAASVITSAGGRYVEGAVMTSVPPYRSRVPLLLGGPDAAALEPSLRALGFEPKTASDKLGVASATKMCRSVMIKGLEAMVIESFTAARAYGVEDAVIASLYETFPAIDWQTQGSYMFQRVIEHGRRRGEEMREVAHTVSEAGLQPFSAAGTAERDEWITGLADDGLFGARDSTGFARSDDWRIEADRIIAAMKARN